MPITKDARNVLVQARLPEDLVKEVDHWSIEWGCYRAEALERLLRDALRAQRERVQTALWPSPPRNE